MAVAATQRAFFILESGVLDQVCFCSAICFNTTANWMRAGVCLEMQYPASLRGARCALESLPVQTWATGI